MESKLFVFNDLLFSNEIEVILSYRLDYLGIIFSFFFFQSSWILNEF